MQNLEFWAFEAPLQAKKKDVKDDGTQLLLIGQSNVSKRWLLLLCVSKISTNLFSGPAKDGVSVRVLGHDNDGPANFLPTGKVNDHFHS